MKMMRAMVALTLSLFVTQSMKALTFFVSNKTNMPVMINVYWRDSLKKQETIQPWGRTKEYNTWGTRVQVINWWYEGDNRCYGADLRLIESGAMVNREFAILDNGHFAHTLTKFPVKQASGQSPRDWDCVNVSEESESD